MNAPPEPDTRQRMRATLLKIAAVSQVLYGTDFPFRTSIEHVEGLRTCGFSTTELNAIERDNALQLLPRLGR